MPHLVLYHGWCFGIGGRPRGWRRCLMDLHRAFQLAESSGSISKMSSYASRTKPETSQMCRWLFRSSSKIVAQVSVESFARVVLAILSACKPRRHERKRVRRVLESVSMLIKLRCRRELRRRLLCSKLTYFLEDAQNQVPAVAARVIAEGTKQYGRYIRNHIRLRCHQRKIVVAF
jgi:hypothetical protein